MPRLGDEGAARRRRAEVQGISAREGKDNDETAEHFFPGLRARAIISLGIRRGVKEGARRIFARGFCTSFPTSPLLYRSAKSKGKTKDSGCQPCCGLTRVFHPQEKERKPRSSSHLALACCPNDALPSRCPPCALGRRCPEPRCGGVAPFVHHQGAIARSSNQGVVVARPYCMRFHRLSHVHPTHCQLRCIISAVLSRHRLPLLPARSPSRRPSSPRPLTST